MITTYICAAIWSAWWSGWLLVGVSSKPTAAREPFRERLPHLLPLAAGVSLLFSPVAIPGYFPLNWTDLYRYLAIGGVVAGLGFASWARIHLGRNWSGLVAIKEGHELVRTGPYRFLRHPIYTGLAFSAVMTAFSVNTCGSVIGSALCIVAFIVKLSHEERLLKQVFGTEYAQLRDAVPNRIVPGFF